MHLALLVWASRECGRETFLINSGNKDETGSHSFTLSCFTCLL